MGPLVARAGLAVAGAGPAQVGMGARRTLEYSSRRNGTSGGKEDPLGRLVEGGSSHNACSVTPTQQAASATSRSLPEGTLLGGPRCLGTWRKRWGGTEDIALSSQGLHLTEGVSRRKLLLTFFFLGPQPFPRTPFPPDASIQFKPVARIQSSHQLACCTPASLPSSQAALWVSLKGTPLGGF